MLKKFLYTTWRPKKCTVEESFMNSSGRTPQYVTEGWQSGQGRVRLTGKWNRKDHKWLTKNWAWARDKIGPKRIKSQDHKGSSEKIG